MTQTFAKSEYYSITDCETETEISRSRFITKAYHIESEDEATDRLKQLKKQYSDATHICYGYVADIMGNLTRFSDAGEPAGTAGQPIIDAIIKKNLRQTMVAVVRYFGGIKLGAGGLSRAYGGCASEILTAATKTHYILSDIYTAQTDFSVAEKLKRYYTEKGRILDTQYSDTVTVTIAVPALSGFEEGASEIAGGKIKIEQLNTKYIIF